ncbi:NUDIX domain-containing protein [Tatumella sp. JGM118]|uniref:NUDIX domain-containing protein n=1 Tax=Tatumella sp. JGM118 TaxID=2799796 RepID=UPI001BAFF61B|nr:NUDIX domain-containing protein [Tatumella sp. JGM118]
MKSPNDRIRIVDVRTLSDDWYLLEKYTFDFQCHDGSWQRLNREAYDHGDGAAVLLFNREKRTVILTRQFRLPAFVNGGEGMLIEVAAGLLEAEDPETRVRQEAEEETGYRISHVRKVFEAWMSPGSVTEKLHLFVAEYHPEDRVSRGGGLSEEGEDLEVLEMPFTEAMQAMNNGTINDGKTIMLLQYAALNQLM